jgi:hypothetical protein
MVRDRDTEICRRSNRIGCPVHRFTRNFACSRQSARQSLPSTYPPVDEVGLGGRCGVGRRGDRSNLRPTRPWRATGGRRGQAPRSGQGRKAAGAPRVAGEWRRTLQRPRPHYSRHPSLRCTCPTPPMVLDPRTSRAASHPHAAVSAADPAAQRAVALAFAPQALHGAHATPFP